MTNPIKFITAQLTLFFVLAGISTVASAQNCHDSEILQAAKNFNILGQVKIETLKSAVSLSGGETQNAFLFSFEVLSAVPGNTITKEEFDANLKYLNESFDFSRFERVSEHFVLSDDVAIVGFSKAKDSCVVYLHGLDESGMSYNEVTSIDGKSLTFVVNHGSEKSNDNKRTLRLTVSDR